MDDEVEELKKEIRKKAPKLTIKPEDLLSSGSTGLNLACSGHYKGAFARGFYYFFVGDSTSGKSWIILTCLAEAAINPNFENYRFVYDNIEDGALMDMKFYFGKEMAKRVEPPRKWNDGSPRYSETIEEFYDNVQRITEEGPCIYLLDSHDALSSESAEKKAKKQKRARETNTAAAGSMGDGKAKVNSQEIRRCRRNLKKSGSILIIVSQSRDLLGGFGFETQTYSGGRALKFYATLQMWTSVRGKLKKTVKGKPRQIGMISRIKVKKNRQTGKERFVDIPIYHSHGIDDIEWCIRYLIEENHWKGTKGKVRAPEFDYEGSIEGLIHHIEENDSEIELQRLAGQVWNEIESKCTVTRKRRYD